MKKIKNFKLPKTNPNIWIIIINVIALVLGSLFIGILKTMIVVLIINALYFLIIKNKFWKRKTKQNENKGTKTKKRKKRKILNIIFAIFLIIILLIIGACSFFAYLIIKDAPEFNEQNLYMKEPSILYDKDGVEFAKLGAENREIINYNQMSEALIDAIIATEDSRFFQHNGVDLPRFIKASVGQIMGKDAGGASTITMQISKKNYTSTVTSGFEGIKRKFTDIYMSVFKLEKKYTKQQIIELYANSNALGAGSYGVEEACQTYFGKAAKDVNIAEAAMIAGLFQAPSAYNPLIYPENAEKRRKEVLTLMERHGYITSEEKKIANALTVDKLLAKKSNENEDKYQSFIDVVVNEVIKKTELDPYSTGMEIYTTMDRNKQEFIDNIMYGNGFAWENDVVTAGISVIDVDTGEIAAIGGNRKTGKKMYNNATMNKRQVGSTSKPLYDYGPAIEYNNWSTGMPIVDENYEYSNGTDMNNWDGKYKGIMTIRNALKESRNIPALKTFQQVKNSDIKTFVTNLGLSPEVDGGHLHEAHSIGAYNGESALTMSAAYAAFANKGVYNEPHSFTKLIFRDSNEVYENKPIKNKAMSEETAYMVTSMLYTTSTYALGNYSKVHGYTYAAKTGTTNYDTATKEANNLPDSAIPDLWVVGYDADYSIAVWYGYDQIYSDNYLKFGNNQNLKLFQTVAKGVMTGAVVEKPEGVEEVAIELQTYPIKLPSAHTPSHLISTELFKKGTAPTEVSDRFTQLANVTNLNGDIKEGVLTLSWDPITTPTAINESYIRGELSALYRNINSGVNSRISYNNSNIGTLVYDIYMKDKYGNLSYMGTTSDSTYTKKLNNLNSDTVSFVVKSVYTIFKNNASSGMEIKLKFEQAKSVITAELRGKSQMTVDLSSTYTDEGVIVLENAVPVSNDVTISISAIGTNSGKTFNNKTISSITDEADTYNITYKVTYKDFTDTLTRTVIVEQKQNLN